MKVKWTSPAIQDLDRHIAYIAQENPSAAREQLRLIRKQYRVLAQHSKMGRPGRVAETRELVINRTPFVLVYRLAPEQVEILKMLHGSQQWPLGGSGDDGSADE